MHRIKYLITAGLSVVALNLGTAAGVLAQSSRTPTPQNTANNGQALEIAPPVITITANPGQSVKTQILLRNISSGALVVSGTANDFVAAGEDGTPKVILDEESSDNPYSMKAWITPPATITLVPKEIKTMTVNINVPANASPGGHYGIIRFTATAPSLTGQGVSISASLGSLVLMTVNGQLNENMSIGSFTANKNGRTGSLFESAPVNFSTRIKNNGNVHEQPIGQIVIKDMFGKQIASLNVNLPPKNVLPNSTRKFESPLDKSVIGTKKLFGHYSAKLTVTYGLDKKKVTSSLSFWVIPWKVVIIVIGLIVGGFFLIRYGLRRYNRYIIGRSNRPRR